MDITKIINSSFSKVDSLGQKVKEFISQYEIVNKLEKYTKIGLLAYPVISLINLLPIDWYELDLEFVDDLLSFAQDLGMTVFSVSFILAFASRKYKDIMTYTGLVTLTKIIRVISYFSVHRVTDMLFFGAIAYYFFLLNKWYSGEPITQSTVQAPIQEEQVGQPQVTQELQVEQPQELQVEQPQVTKTSGGIKLAKSNKDN